MNGFASGHGRNKVRRAPKVKNCILIWLAGGPSHIDTFDPKPAAAVDVRGEFKPIATPVPGLQISEVFPKIAKFMDRVTLIRSMTSPEADHDRAAHHMLTGYRPSPALVYPGYGSVVSKVREATRGMLPPYVAVPDAPIFASSGYLTPAYDPFSVSGDPNQENFKVRNLTPPDRLTLERLLRRREMVKKLDDFAHDVPGTPLTSSRDQFAERAYSLLTSSAAQSAFRLNQESPAVREKYGRTTVGQSCLLARRLVEAGVSFVTFNDRGTGPSGLGYARPEFPYDQEHAGTAARSREWQRSSKTSPTAGLLDSTLVVMMGEFGRTPKINPNAGRERPVGAAPRSDRSSMSAATSLVERRGRRFLIVGKFWACVSQPKEPMPRSLNVTNETPASTRRRARSKDWPTVVRPYFSRTAADF